MKKAVAASATLGTLALLCLIGDNESTVLGRRHTRTLQQYLQTSGTETISMDDNGMMTSTSTFTMTDFSEHIKRVKHHVHKAQERLKATAKHLVEHIKKGIGIGEDKADDKALSGFSVGKASHHEAKQAGWFTAKPAKAKEEDSPTKEEIAAYVNQREVVEKYHWSKATAALKVKYFHSHPSVFKKFKAGAFDKQEKPDLPVKEVKRTPQKEQPKEEKPALVQKKPSAKSTKKAEPKPSGVTPGTPGKTQPLQKNMSQMVQQYRMQLIAIGVVILAAGVLAVMRQRRAGDHLEQHYAEVASEIHRYPGSTAQV